MPATSSTISKLFVAMLVAFTLVNASCSRKKDKPAVTGIDATVDATNSDIVVSGGPVTADGNSSAAVAITLKDIKGDAVAGVTPVFAAEPATGIDVSTMACTASDANGVSSCELKSTVAETKTVSIVYPIQKAGNTVDFQAGAIAKVCISAQPGGGTAGVAWAQQPSFFIGDEYCNLVNTATNSVLAATTNVTMGTLAGTATVAAVAGVGSFSNLSLTVAGSKTLALTSAGLTGGTTSAFNVNGNVAASMLFSTQPGGGSASIAWPQQPVIRFNDTYGNVASLASNQVTLVNLATGNLGGGAISRNAAAGIAAFSGLHIDTIGTKALRAVAVIGGGTVTVDSGTFAISAGAPAQMVFSTQPANGTIGSAIGQQPVVQIRDAAGNVVTTATNAVTMELLTGSGTLAGAVTRSASAGVATFTNLSINATGNKVLRANASGLPSVTSGTFSVAAAAAAQLCFEIAPGPSEVAGEPFVNQPSVFIGDAGCNIVPSGTGTIAISIASGSGALLGTSTLATSSGYANFSNLAMTLIGTKRLRATYSGTLGITPTKDTGTFSISAGTPAALFFSAHPGNGTAGVELAQQPTIQVRDAYGNVSNANEPIGIALTSGSMGVLTGAGTFYSSNGILGVTSLAVNTPGVKSITATSGTLVSATSNNFNIVVGPATQLQFVTQPGTGTAMVAFATQPRVVVQDSQGNTVNSSASISLALGVGSSGTLGGVSTVSASNGTASFSGLNIDQVGAKTLVASSAGLSDGTTGTFTIGAGPFTRLCYIQQPGASVAGVAFAQQPVVQLSDSGCNATGGTNSVSMSVLSGGGTLFGTTTLSASSGTASFSGLNMQLAGAKVLRATSGTITADTSSFTVSPATPSQLVFNQQPGNGVSGVALPTQPWIQVRDAYSNIATNSSLAIAMNLTNGSMGVLTGAGTTTASGGTIAYSGLSVNLSGAKTLTVSSGTLSATSNVFTISAGSASRLAFVVEPGGGTANIAWLQQPRVAVTDAAGNFVSSSANISLSILAPGTGSMSGTTSIVATSGTAAYAGLSIDVSETGKRLVASSAGLTSGTSATFNILTGPFTRLCLVAQPGTSTAGIAFPIQPEYRLGDSACNQVMSATNTVSLSVQSGTGTLVGSSSLAATAGYAAFTGLSMQVAGAKVLRATSGTITVDTSSFTVNPAPASKLVFTTQPSNGTSGIALLTQPVVQFQDPYNNLVSSSANVGLSVSSGALSGTGTVAASAGVATFTGLSFNTVGAKTLSATSGTLSGTSGTFNIAHGSANRLVYTTQPGGGTAGIAWLQQPVVTVQDAAGNTVTTGSVAVALAVTTGSGTMSGTTTRFSSSGVATFTGLSMTVAGTDKVLTATSSGLTAAVSTPAFTIAPGAPSASLSTFSASPTSLFAAGTLYSSTLSGVILDAYSNPIPSKTVYVASSRGASDNFVGTAAVSNASGQVSYSVSSTTAGVGTMSISIPADSVTVTQRPVITFNSWVATLANSSWSISPVTVAADGVDTATVNVTLRNASGTALPSKAVTLVSSRGATDTIATSPATTNGSGQATFTVRSSTRGEPTFTIASSGDSLNLTTAGKVIFYDVAPVADWQAQLAVSSVNSMGPGTAGVSTWKDLFNLGPNDGTVYNLGTIATSGWCGSGTGTVGTCAAGPYRLSLDGTNDYVNFGTGLNSFASRTHELWVRPTLPTDKGELIMSNGDTGNRGLTIRQAWDGTGRVELTAGESLSYPGEVWQDTPIAYWRMNETSGTTALAVIGTNMLYTTMGTIGSPTGIQDNGASAFFNGSNSYAQVGNLYPPTTTMTISAMIYPTITTGTRVIAGKSGAANTGYSLELVGGRLQFRSRTSAGAQSILGSTTLSTNTWYHVSATRTASALTVYINGVSDGSGAASGTVTTLTNNFNIGRSAGAFGYFAGRIEEVAVYNTALAVGRLVAQNTAKSQHTCYSTAALTANQWRHLSATFDDTSKNMSLYVNGALQCTRSATGYNNGSSTYPLAIGAEVNAGGTASVPYFQGMFGDVRVYDSALSAGQLLNNYNATSSRFP